MSSPMMRRAPVHHQASAERPVGTLRRLLTRIVRGNGWVGSTILIAIIISAAAGVIGALFTQQVIDGYIVPLLGVENPSFSSLARVIALMAGVYLLGVFATWLYNWLTASLAQNTMRRLRDDMFSHVQRLPIRYFDSTAHGDIMSRFTNDADTLRQMITQALPQMIASLATVIAVLTAMFVLSWQLTLVVLVGGVIMVIVSRVVLRISGRFFSRQQRSIGQVNGLAEELINGLRVVKVFNHEQVAIADFTKRNDQLFGDAARANTLANILMPIVANLGNALYVCVALGGAALAFGTTTAITVGTIAAFLQLTRSFTMPLNQLSQQFNSVVMALAGAERIFALLDETPETDDGTVTLTHLDTDDGTATLTDNNGLTAVDATQVTANAAQRSDATIEEPDTNASHTASAPLPTSDADGRELRREGHWAWQIPGTSAPQAAPSLSGNQTTPDMPGTPDTASRSVPVRGDVRFEHVTFGYEPGVPVLHDISLYAKPGQKVAFVGSTGAGKTTITNLINRFYDIDSGSITYDGIDILDLHKEDLRRSLGIVLQDTQLFTGTVAENIRYGRLDATDEEVRAAARLANAHEFIGRLPQGYDTPLGGSGDSLSQGQRQLLSIARAAIADAPVMILDEATSSIDTHTEQLVQSGMDALMAGRTVFVIAHRLSTIRNADVIMVLEHGRIIERGTHGELFELGGRYRELLGGKTPPG